MTCVNCDNEVCSEAEDVGLNLCINCLDDYYIDREIEIAESSLEL